MPTIASSKTGEISLGFIFRILINIYSLKLGFKNKYEIISFSVLYGVSICLISVHKVVCVIYACTNRAFLSFGEYCKMYMHRCNTVSSLFSWEEAVNLGFLVLYVANCRQ